jgi:hypothetical protein
MAEPSAFAGLEPAQLHYLKAQYLASLQMLDQAEATLKAQLDEVAKTRKHVESLMHELDAQLTGEAKQPAPAKPAAKPKPRRTTRRRTVNN